MCKFLILISIIGLLTGLALTHAVYAHQDQNRTCHKYSEDHCIQQTFQNSCPTHWSQGGCPTPTATPTPALIPTPTVDPCAEDQCVTPTPKPPDPLSQAPAGPAPSCSDPAPAVQPWNFVVVRHGDTAKLNWIPGDSAVVDVFYKQVDAKDWQYSWTGLNTGYTTISYLSPNIGYTFTLRGRNACSDGKFISPVVVDGAYNQTFLTTYWLVW